MTEVRLVTEAADAGAGAGPEGERIGVIKDYFGNLLAEYSAPADSIVFLLAISLVMNAGNPLFGLGVV